jgi:phosphopantetheinyl transferase (holo-ACP synthase)
MTNPTVRIHNTETDEVIEREMTAEELAQFEADKAESLAMKEAQAKAAAEKAALLAKLGITDDEAKLLLS